MDGFSRRESRKILEFSIKNYKLNAIQQEEF
jgi:hypothetical protein